MYSQEEEYDKSIYPLLNISFKRMEEIHKLICKGFYEVSLDKTKMKIGTVAVFKDIQKHLKNNYEIAAVCMQIGRVIESSDTALYFITEGKKLSKLN